jgi:hypothetical protein
MYIMKKIFRNKRVIIIAFFTVFSITRGPAAFAKGGGDSLPVELKFIGNLNNQLLLQLNFAGNADENEFTILIKDHEENTIFMENIKGENFYKKFLLNSDEIGDNTIRFEVIGKKSGKSVVFDVNPAQHSTEKLAANTVH